MRRIFFFLLSLSLLLIPCRGIQEAPAVALTFDDGPSGRFTRQLLEGLEQREAAATFFLCGYRLAEAPELAQRILEEGHEIGLHGYSHQDLSAMTGEQMKTELRRTRALLPQDALPVLLRPPGGLCSQTLCRAAEAENLAVVIWSVDPKDWALKDADAVTRRVMDTVRDGDVILMHDLSESSVEAALCIADQLKARGFQLCTVSELAQRKGVALLPGEKYFRFP